MNATVQALNNIDVLRPFFLSGAYQQDMGQGRQLVTSFAELLTRLQMSIPMCFRPSHFKAVVGRCFPDFNNNDQQDAEEFLTFCLARLRQSLHKPPAERVATCDADLAWDEYPPIRNYQKTKIIIVFVATMVLDRCGEYLRQVLSCWAPGRFRSAVCESSAARRLR